MPGPKRPRRRVRVPRWASAAAVVGAVAVLGVLALPRAAVLAPTPTPPPPLPPLPPAPRQIAAQEARPYAAFVFGRQSLQIPIGAVRPLPPGNAAVESLSGLTAEQGVLLIGGETRTAPLALGAQPVEPAVIYVGADDAVVEVRRRTDPDSETRPVAPYRLALVVPAAVPGLDGLLGGERFVPFNLGGPGGQPDVAAARRPTIPVPPAGTAGAYPGRVGPTPSPRATVSRAYPSP